MIILASASPRRQELLRQVGLSFQTIPSRFDEKVATPMPPGDLVEHLALAKARDVGARYPQDVVIGADTVVVVDGDVLGKPKDRPDAIAMLSRLSGRAHQVFTGVAIVVGEQQAVAHETTTVHFVPLERDQIERYIDTGEPMDKAGAYGIQGRAATLIRSIDGDYFNVVGLPLCRMAQLLAPFGVSVT